VTATSELDLAFAGPAALADMVRAREVHPRELVELYLRRIERLDPRLNAFRTTRAERALAEAAQTEGSEGPLAGVPIAVKDDLAVAGEVATKGTRSIHAPAPADAEAIRRLRAAGAIPIGITRVPELMIFPWTATDAGGITRNPWNPERTPGGSSGGSASAVAAGLAAAATGSDGGGSIRIPAACCGLVGMKPTRGRVSGAPAGAGWLGLSVYGALARTVRDSALMLDVMHGALPDDPTPAPPFTGSYVEAAGRAPAPLRIAASRKLAPGLLARISAEQRGAWERTCSLLGALGHDVAERDPAYGLAQYDFVQTWMRGIYEESLHVPDRSLLEHAADGGRRPIPGPAVAPAPAACRPRPDGSEDPGAVGRVRRAGHSRHCQDRDRRGGWLRALGAGRDRHGESLHTADLAVQPHGPAGRGAARRDRRGRPAAERPARRPARGRGSALLPGGTDRGGRAMGRQTPGAGDAGLRRRIR
jgi:amidase